MDYLGEDEKGVKQHLNNTIWFYAFNDMAEDLLKNALKNDQLIIEAQPRSKDRVNGSGGRVYEIDFFVTSFKYGAKGRGPYSASGQRERFDNPPPLEPAEGAAAVVATA